MKETVIFFLFPGVHVLVLLYVCFLAFTLLQALVSLQIIHEGMYVSVFPISP